MSTELLITEEKKEIQPEQPTTDGKKEIPPEQLNGNDKKESPKEQSAVATTENTAFEEPTPSLNYTSLKELEGTIVSSFKELVKKVILLNGNPFIEFTYKDSKGIVENLKITSGRKKVYLRIIEDYAVLEFIGNKCRVVAVLEEKSVDKALNKAKKAQLQKRFKRV